MNVDMNSDQEISKLYLEYRDDFIRNTAKYQLSVEKKIDIYQDAFIVIYEGLKKGNIKIETSLKHYLYGVGRNMIIDEINNQIKERKLKDGLSKEKEAFDIDLSSGDVLSEKQELLLKGINSLSEKCREILILFYYRKYSIEAIMHTMNYQNENVTKSHKSRCLKQLKTNLQKQ